LRFFSLCFISVLLLFTAIRFFHISLTAQVAVVLPGSFFLRFIDSARGRLPVTLFLTVLLSLSYTARRAMPLLLSIGCVLALAVGWTALSSLGIVKADDLPMPSVPDKTILLGEPGFMVLSNNETQVRTKGPDSPRFVSLPDKALVYQETVETDSAPLKLPMPFRDEQGFIVQDITLEFTRVADHFEMLLNEGFRSFMIYAAALVFLLVSMRFIMDVSSWPLANLFFGVLAFRGILMLELFIDSPATNGIIASFLQNAVPQALISPLAFCAVGVLLIGLTELLRLLLRRRHA
jgi:hypothetical protein